MKKTLIILFALTLIVSCSTNTQTKDIENLVDSAEQAHEVKTSHDIYLDNLRQIKLDTSTIIGKYKKIIADLWLDYSITPGGVDTLIDLNYDNAPDILVEYYGASGSGLKNYIYVYLFDKSKNNFYRDTFLSKLISPSFHFKQKIVTSYYIANGGGYAEKFYWDGKVSRPIERFLIDIIDKNNKLTVTYQYKYFDTHKSRKYTDSIVDLPDIYNYCDYKPIIKHNGI